MALMQAVDKMKYTPFFYLCERNHKFNNAKQNQYFPRIIRELINEVNDADSSCFGDHESHHYADYNFVHKDTEYTCLHWLAYHNDA